MSTETTDTEVVLPPPTCQQLFDEDGVASVYREADDSWRHGSRVTEVFSRVADGTYWRAEYRLSADGETHELREGIATITRVYPYRTRITRYSTAPQGDE